MQISPSSSGGAPTAFPGAAGDGQCQHPIPGLSRPGLWELHQCCSPSSCSLGKRSLEAAGSCPRGTSTPSPPWTHWSLHSHWKGGSADGSRLRARLCFPVPRLLSRAFRAPAGWQAGNLQMHEQAESCQHHSPAGSAQGKLPLDKPGHLQPAPRAQEGCAGVQGLLQTQQPSLAHSGKCCQLCWSPEPLKMPGESSSRGKAEAGVKWLGQWMP